MKRGISLLLVCGMLIGAMPFAAAAANYADVPKDAWYAQAVDYVTERGLMQGTGNGQFSPDLSLTRAQFVTLLHRLAGSPSADISGLPFGDVAPEAYYAPGVAWANQNGIVTGTTATSFTPNRAINREQMAAILYRYVQTTGKQLPNAKNPVYGFKDAWYVSDYAVNGVELVWHAGIMNGDSQYNFGPKIAVSRADAADVFMRLDRCLSGESLTVSVRNTTPNYAAMSQREKTAQALTVAKQIASVIPREASDLDRVSIAARIVSYYCSFCAYTMSGSDYRTPFGVFVKGEYSCAGATRALGLVLDCLGYQWTHVNENQYDHQWCSLYMDGQLGFADGQTGIAGYGEHWGIMFSLAESTSSPLCAG